MNGNTLSMDGTFKAIRSFKHQLYTVEQKKTTLVSFDSKQYMLDPCNSLSYGHYRIQQIKDNQLLF